MSENWSDQGERRRWEDALLEVADRLRQERGLEDPADLTTSWFSEGLWAHYGELQVKVVGPDAQVTTPDELFEEIDWWAAARHQAGGQAQWRCPDADCAAVPIGEWGTASSGRRAGTGSLPVT